MNKFLRNKNFLFLSASLALEFVLSFILLILVLVFAKHYDVAAHKAGLIVVGLMLAANHGLTVFLGIWGLSVVERHTSVTLSHSHQKTIYWNAIICGFLFYPVFAAWFAYKHSGFTKEEINEFTKKYIYKHFELVSDIAEVGDKLDVHFKEEHENVKQLVADRHLQLVEGNKYLFDYLFAKGIISEEILTKIEEENIEKIIEDAN